MKPVLAVSVLLWLTVQLSAQLSYDRIRQADREPGNWLTTHGTYDAKRFSTLDQIDRTNVQQLRPVWMHQVQGRHHFETTPLVFDGVMYITEPPSDVTALDVKTGRPIWSYRRPLPRRRPRVLRSGQSRRRRPRRPDLHRDHRRASRRARHEDRAACGGTSRSPTTRPGYSMTAAPLAVKDKIIVGVAGGEYRHPRLSRRLRREDRQAGVALLDRAGAGRAGPRDLGRRQLEVRRRDRPG